MFDITQHEGEGLDTLETTQALPLLRIIQDGSPIVKKSDPKHEEKKIEGAEAGDIAFAGHEAFKELEVIALHGEISYTEWDNGKPVANHCVSIVSHPDYRPRGHDPQKKNLERLGPNQIDKTNNYFVKFREPGGEWRKGIIPFTSTQLKNATNWGKLLNNLKYDDGKSAPIFCSVWTVKTKSESNDHGSWYGWDIQFKELLDLEADIELLEESVEDRKSAIGDAAQMLTKAEDNLQLEDSDVAF